MEDSLKKLEKWLADLDDFSLPSYKELPSIDLYMEQVLGYINEALAPLSDESKKAFLTSFMVNNYVKAKLLEGPTKKKYSKNQIGYLIAISLLKQSLSLEDVSTLISLEGYATKDPTRLYEFFRSLEMQAIKSSLENTKKHLASTKEEYEKIKSENPEEAEEFLTARLALVSARLAVRSEVDKLIAEQLIDFLEERKQEPQEEKKKKKKAKEESSSAHSKKEIQKQMKKNKENGK